METLHERGSGAVNEDTLVEKGNLFGVFDGATSLDKRCFQDGLTGGFIAAETAARSFRKKNLPLHLLARKANSAIRRAQSRENIGPHERHKLWSTSLAVVRLTEYGLEYCQTGDALIVLVTEEGEYRLITPDIDIDRNTLKLWKDMEVSPDAHIHDTLADQIREVRLQMNISYGVLNGEPEALDFIHYGFEELTGVSDILLFTDGLHLPRENPSKQHDWQTFVDLYLRGGLQAVRNYVRRVQATDPGCRKYPRFKVHDDIAAVSITLS